MAALGSRSFRKVPLEVRQGLLSAHTICWEAEGAEGGGVGGSAPSGKVELARGTRLPLHKRLTIPCDATLHVSCQPVSDGAAVSVECTIAPRPAKAALGAGLRSFFGGGGGRVRQLRLDVTVDANQLPAVTACEVDAAEAAESAEEEEEDDDDDDEVVLAAGDLAGEEAGDEAGDGTEGASDSDGGEGAPEGAPAKAPPKAAEKSAEQPAEKTTPVALEISSTLGLSVARLQALRAVEEELAAVDRRVEKMLAAKNELEATLYSTRAALGERLQAGRVARGRGREGERGRGREGGRGRGREGEGEGESERGRERDRSLTRP